MKWQKWTFLQGHEGQNQPNTCSLEKRNSESKQSILWKIPDKANIWKISIRHKKSNKESAKLTKNDIE